VHNHWGDECKRLTFLDDQRLFGAGIAAACPYTVANRSSQTQLLFQEERFFKDCFQTIKIHGRELEEKSRRDKEGGLVVLETTGPTRGDQALQQYGEEDASDVEVRTLPNRDMAMCVAYHDGCKLTYYHDQLESDTFFENRLSKSELDGRMVLVVHTQVDNTTWSALACGGGVSLAIVMGTSMGALLLVGLGLLVAAVVIINVNDLRRWKQYQAWKMENEDRLGQVTNPLYEDKEEIFQNPMYGQ
jgi:hypothetical protein